MVNRRLRELNEIMKISIIIPVYNAENFLKECLESVISQTIKEKEILCIDDGSTDDSYEILQQYQRKYPFIRVFRQENKGAGEARNIGLKEAVGRYVCFLDADDFYLDSKALEKMVYACESNRVQACAGLRKLYKIDMLESFHWCRNYFEDGKNPKGIILDYKDAPDDYYYTNYVFALEPIRKNGILFPPYRRYEDPPFFLKAMIEIKKYIVLPVEFYGYRFAEEAIARKNDYIKDTLKGIRDNIKTAQENQLYELEKVLIGRIGIEYVAGVVLNASEEILDYLYEIRGMVFGKDIPKEYEDAQTKAFDNVLILMAMNLKGAKLGDYFEKKGITNVAVYGLGNYGKVVIRELKKSDRIILYGVDQKIKERNDVKIVTLEEANKKCGDIIVTPAEKNTEIANEIRRSWKGNVWQVNTLLRQVLKDQERGD